MKYKQLLERAFTEFHEPWMDEQDKKIMNEKLMQQFGAQFERDIEVGISNGCSAEDQEAIVRRIFRSAKR